MVSSPSIRVWLTHSPSSNPTENFRPKRDDIILVYNPDTMFQGITDIYGYVSGTQGYMHRVLSTAIREAELLRAFSANNRLLNIRSSGTEFLLPDGDWQTLRNLIINANPDLISVVGELEARQHKLPELVGVEALIFDATRTAIQIFNPAKLSDILKYLDMLRKNIAAHKDMSVSDQIAEGLKQSGLAQPLNSIADLSPLQQKMIEQSRRNYREVDAIENDFDNPGAGLTRISGRIPSDMARKIAVFSDDLSGRSLTLYMAHQADSGSADLAASDLIYVNEERCSIIFVQYKRLSKQNTVDLDADDQDQLRDLLNVCQSQPDGCTNCPGGSYKPEHLLRLSDCPTLYKFVNHELKISPESKSMEGDYIQACLLDRLLEEPSSNKRKEILKRAVPHGSFIGLMKRTQIGCRAEGYEQLTEIMLGRKAVVAVQSQVRSPRTRRRR